jgi:cysteinyl-tRNA synthetase
MSKSFGNIVRIRDMMRKYNSNTIRLYLFSKHYREPIMFSESELGKFQSTDEIVANALWSDVNTNTKKPHHRTKLTNKFTSYLENDVNTPAALQLMIETAKKGHSTPDLQRMARIFGLVY